MDLHPVTEFFHELRDDDFQVAIDLLAGSDNMAQYFARETLKTRTTASGSGDEIIARYAANREKLTFDPETKRFFVQP